MGLDVTQPAVGTKDRYAYEKIRDNFRALNDRFSLPPLYYPTLEGGFYTAPDSVVAYSKDPFGIVHLQDKVLWAGSMTSTKSRIIFTLPTGFRPQGYDTSTYVTMYPSRVQGLAGGSLFCTSLIIYQSDHSTWPGGITVAIGSIAVTTASIYLDGITFKAA